jgi:hypothetical protein
MNRVFFFEADGRLRALRANGQGDSHGGERRRRISHGGSCHRWHRGTDRWHQTLVISSQDHAIRSSFLSESRPFFLPAFCSCCVASAHLSKIASSIILWTPARIVLAQCGKQSVTHSIQFLVGFPVRMPYKLLSRVLSYQTNKKNE